MNAPKTDKWTQLKTALENPKYEWRTVRGLIRETGLDESELLAEMKAHEGQIIRSSIPNKRGEDLFTTRDHYRKKASIWERLNSSIQMKVR
jgi:hypothetical protein